MQFTPIITDDGSFTFFSPDFGEMFHSHYGAYQESLGKFIIPTQLHQKAKKSDLYLLDICYGLGYNSAAALMSIWDVNPNCIIHLRALELDINVPQTAIDYDLLNIWSGPIASILTQLSLEQKITLHSLHAQLLLGDARQTITTVYESGFKADAIFLDPFSPPVCPQLWTVDFLSIVAKCLKQDGLLATYSCAASVRNALILAGLHIGSSPPVGRRSPGTIASYFPLDPLSQSEQEHLLTRAGIPYRDYSLSDSANIILQRRIQEQQKSTLEPTSRWRKRTIIN